MPANLKISEDGNKETSKARKNKVGDLETLDLDRSKARQQRGKTPYQSPAAGKVECRRRRRGGSKETPKIRSSTFIPCENRRVERG